MSMGFNTDKCTLFIQHAVPTVFSAAVLEQVYVILLCALLDIQLPRTKHVNVSSHTFLH